MIIYVSDEIKTTFYDVDYKKTKICKHKVNIPEEEFEGDFVNRWDELNCEQLSMREMIIEALENKK